MALPQPTGPLQDRTGRAFDCRTAMFAVTISSAVPAHILCRFASKHRSVPRGVPRRNHKWGTRHLVAPSRDVGAAGRRESFAEVRYRCGFGETWRFLCFGL